ncbi:MAG: hypothetical protein V1904_02645 [Bacteroidota bacterium]
MKTRISIYSLMIIILGVIILPSCGAQGKLSSTAGGRIDNSDVKSDSLKKQ